MNVLITGGAGFIGTRLADSLLTAGHGVLVFDKVTRQTSSHAMFLGDVRDQNALAQACHGIDTIYHLAAEHRDDVVPLSLYEEVNVYGSRCVAIAAARASVKRIVFTSTVAVYGLGNPHAREDSEPDPFNPYGESKLAAEQVLSQWAREDAERSLTIVRPCVVFGEGNRGNVHNLLRQVHSGRFVMIGRGDNRKSMAYVGNISQYLATLVTAPPSVTILNYADKPDLSTAELLDVMATELGKKSASPIRLPRWAGLLIGYVFDGLAYILRRQLPVSSMRVRKFCAETSVSTQRLESQTFVRPYTLREGLKNTIRAEFPRKPS
jgi:GlcNAc-P-P-Und epimerase